MGEVDVLRAQIVRQNVNHAWGFRLEGGADTGQPLKILRVTPASPADKIGLRSGDEVTEIGDIPSERLTYQQALEIIQDAGDTLLLTLERKAYGAVPTNPVLSKHIPEGQEGAKFYQPLKMSGGGTGRKFHIVQSKPFHAVEKPRSMPQYQPEPQSPQHPQYQQYQPAQPTVTYQPQPAATYQPQPQPQTVSYSAQPTYQAAGPKPYQPYEPEHQEPEEDPYNPSGHQSRTFRALQSMMENETPYAGSQGLPQQRTVSMDKIRQEEQARRSGSPRVKVFMPQQYNTPMGLYSAQNVMDTFSTQASELLDELGRHREARGQANK